jgi:hypothetical protein
MRRYAVLWDVEGVKSRPIGVALEAGECVLVTAPYSFGLPSRFDGDYRVLQPDSTDVIYRPEDAGYFEQVLLELSRSFAIGERGTVGVVDDATIRHLVQDKVLRPQMQTISTPYTQQGVRHPVTAGRRRQIFRPEAQPLRVAAEASRRTNRGTAA